MKAFIVIVALIVTVGLALTSPRAGAQASRAMGSVPPLWSFRNMSSEHSLLVWINGEPIRRTGPKSAFTWNEYPMKDSNELLFKSLGTEPGEAAGPMAASVFEAGAHTIVPLTEKQGRTNTYTFLVPKAALDVLPASGLEKIEDSEYAKRIYVDIAVRLTEAMKQRRSNALRVLFSAGPEEEAIPKWILDADESELEIHILSRNEMAFESGERLGVVYSKKGEPLVSIRHKRDGVGYLIPSLTLGLQGSKWVTLDGSGKRRTIGAE